MGAFGQSAFKIFLSAGEASGDLHGSQLVRAIRDHAPEAAVTCLGGPLLKAAGATVLVDNRDLAVVGLFEVARHINVIHDAWKKIKTHLTRERPDVVVLIDFPDFNFLLARLARRLGIKVFYYISPQVWAWRSGRVRTLKRLVDRMVVILPFETAFYERYGMKVYYTGHPLLDVLDCAPSRKDARERYRPGDSSFLIGLLPGSRHSEIRSLLPILMDTAEILIRQIPGISFLLPVAPTLERRMIEEEVARRRLPIRVVSGDTYGVVSACDLVLTASGTVTLETAILETPMIIIYRVSDLSYYMGRRLIKVKYVGLPNLMAGRQIVPELLQFDANPERIAAEVMSFFNHPERLEDQHNELRRIKSRLGECGVAGRVAKMVLEECKVRKESSKLEARNSKLEVKRSSKCAAQDKPSTSAFALRAFYSAAAMFCWPFIFFYYRLRSRTDGKYRSSCMERLGLKLPRQLQLPSVDRVWVHALSVGETLSVVPLIKALKEHSPASEIVFSTATETGQKIAGERLSQWVSSFFYLPHDFPWIMDKVVRRLNPSLFILVETDIWPSLLMALNRHHIPAFLVNGRISRKSFRKLTQFSRLFDYPFRCFDLVFTQSAEDREKYVALGVTKDRVHAVGNLKFDSVREPLCDVELASLRKISGIESGRPVWIAGSTHEGEEEILLDTHRKLRNTCPELLLVLAPRNNKRALAVGALCDKRGMGVSYRSSDQSAKGKAVYLLDTLGELSRFYALADIAFIGGSLVPFGGHNPLEAVAQGKPTLWGPHLFNFREIEGSLLEAGCCRAVSSREELERALSKWLRDPVAQGEMRAAAMSFIASHSGCSREIAHRLLREARKTS